MAVYHPNTFLQNAKQNMYRSIYRITSIILFSLILFVQSMPVNADIEGNITNRYGSIEYKKKNADRLSVPELIQRLKHDGIKWNAIVAMNILYARNNEEVKSALLQTLPSHDEQQRLLAAHILRDLQAVPTPELLVVTVESLRVNQFPNFPYIVNNSIVRGDGCVFVFDAVSSVHFLLQHSGHATDLLENALQSDDLQQRFLAAFILAATARTAKVEAVAAILIPHLKHDEISGNAIMAAFALYHLGSSVKPYLEPHLQSDDLQLQQSVKLILKDIENPPVTRAQELSRMSIVKFSYVIADPCVDARVLNNIGQVCRGLKTLANRP